MDGEQQDEDVMLLDQDTEEPSGVLEDDDNKEGVPNPTRSGGSSALPSWALKPVELNGDFFRQFAAESESSEEYMSQPPKQDDAPAGLATQPSDLPSVPDSTAGPSKRSAGGPDDNLKTGTEQEDGPAEEVPSKQTSRSEVVVVMPEKDKLNRNKVIIELEPADHGATDLSGDSGAVGRMLVTGKPGAEEIRIDLKGIIYKASILPLVGTMCVVNIGPTEAKVEAICTDFIRLKEESNFYAADTLVEGNLVEDDISDDEPILAATQGGGDGAGAGPSEKAGKKKKTAKEGKQDAFKALMKGTGGVKKKVAKKLGLAKPKADGKGSAAGAKPAKAAKGGKAGKSKAAAAKKKTSAAKKGGSKAAGKKAKKSKD